MPKKTKEEQRLYAKEHYQKHKEKYQIRDKKRKDDVRQWVKNYKVNKGCKVCKEKHPACLHFHHINPNKKEKTISSMIANRISLKKIKIEIAKCEILCANCHAKEHYYE